MSHGFKYPPAAQNGQLMISDNNVSEAIMSAIQTRYGERVFRNGYGNNVDEFRTVNDGDALLSELTEAIIDSCQEYLPFNLLLSGTVNDDGTTTILVEYDDDDRTRTLTVVV